MFLLHLDLESNDPNEVVEWYEVNSFDQEMIYTPILSIESSKTTNRIQKHGAKDKDYFWYTKSVNRMELRQALSSTIYCSFDFKYFPFDTHKCDLIFGDATLSIAYSTLNPTIMSYQDQEIRYGEGLLQVNQSRLPFDISLKSLTPFEQAEMGSNILLRV